MLFILALQNLFTHPTTTVRSRSSAQGTCTGGGEVHRDGPYAGRTQVLQFTLRVAPGARRAAGALVLSLTLHEVVRRDVPDDGRGRAGRVGVGRAEPLDEVRVDELHGRLVHRLRKHVAVDEGQLRRRHGPELDDDRRRELAQRVQRVRACDRGLAAPTTRVARNTPRKKTASERFKVSWRNPSRKDSSSKRKTNALTRKSRTSRKVAKKMMRNWSEHRESETDDKSD